MRRAKMLAILVVALGLMVCQARVSEAAPMGTAFTYQGHLYDANRPADGRYDFEFKLFDDPYTGSQQGSTIDVNELDVIDAHFTVELDFGSVFDGDARWLEIGVRPGELEDPNVYTTLSPRQEVTPTPYAIYAATGGTGNSLDAADGSPTDAVYVDNEGNVGIGTSSPATKLDVGGRTRMRTVLSDQTKMLMFDDLSGTMRIYTDASAGTASDLILGTYPNGHLNQLFLQQSTGNVGIGTTSPSAKLHLGSTGNTELRIEHDDFKNSISFYASTSKKGYIEKDDDYGLLRISADGSNDHITIVESSGDVGIGATSAYAKLHVEGSNWGVYGQSSDTEGVRGKNSTSGNYGYLGGSSVGVGGYHSSSGNYGYIAGLEYGIRGEGYGGSAGVRGSHESGNHGILGDLNYGVYGESSSSSGAGVYGKGTGGSKAGYFDGDVHTTGEITKAYTTGTSNIATPIAYAFIDADGNVLCGTPNVSCVWSETHECYRITIAGEYYYSQNYVTVVTLAGIAGPVKTAHASGELWVYVYNLSQVKVQSDFQFVTYKP